MIKEYVHLPVEEPVEFLSSSYWVTGEEKIPYEDKELLAIIRETSCMSCCDGACYAPFKSILLPGFIKKYKYRKRDDGLYISEVEPIEDEALMEKIRKIVLIKYPSTQVEFFCP